MPLSDPHHISPTGVRVSPLSQPDIVPSSRPLSIPISASQLNADIAAYVRELEQLRKLVLLRVMSEADSVEVSELRDALAERDAEIDTLRAMIAEEDK